MGRKPGAESRLGPRGQRRLAGKGGRPSGQCKEGPIRGPRDTPTPFRGRFLGGVAARGYAGETTKAESARQRLDDDEPAAGVDAMNRIDESASADQNSVGQSLLRRCSPAVVCWLVFVASCTEPSGGNLDVRGRSPVLSCRPRRCPSTAWQRALAASERLPTGSDCAAGSCSAQLARQQQQLLQQQQPWSRPSWIAA